MSRDGMPRYSSHFKLPIGSIISYRNSVPSRAQLFYIHIWHRNPHWPPNSPKLSEMIYRQRQSRGKELNDRSDLVTANFLRNSIEGLYYSQPKLLPLLIFRDGDVFDVCDEPEVVYTMPFSSAS